MISVAEPEVHGLEHNLQAGLLARYLLNVYLRIVLEDETAHARGRARLFW